MRTIIAILFLVFLIYLACHAAITPPRPRLPVGLIESPKGKEQRKTVIAAPAAPRAVIVNNRTMVWTWRADATNTVANVVFVVHSSPSLLTPITNWPAIAVCTTNGFPFVLSASVPSMFFYVRASNIISGLVSPWHIVSPN